MELRQLRYFIKAKELLSFTEAAEHLNISQSTLSQQIKQLEDELGMPLFNRIGKRISITEAGNVFAEYARKSLERSLEGFLALQDLKGLKSGQLNIGVSYGLRTMLIPALISFTDKYPAIKIKIIFETTQVLIEQLKKSKLDFVFSFKGEQADSSLNYLALFTSQMVFVTVSAADFAGKDYVTLKEIVALPLVMPSIGYSTTKSVMKAFQEAELIPDISIEVNDIPTLLEMVKTGKWHTILAQTSVIKEKNLLSIPIKEMSMQRTAVIISQKDVYETKAMTAFWKEFKKVLEG
jgi:LysR family transcriptional regulator, cyn operon transcriptional activator